MITQDILWKSIIEDFFPDFLYYFFPKSANTVDLKKGYEFLDKDLEKLMPEGQDKNRRVDKLVKVNLKTGDIQYLLIHIEVQGYEDERFAERMYIYQYRGFDRFRLPIVALAILTDDSPNYHPKGFKFEYNSWGTRLSYEFRTYKLYNQKIKDLEKSRNPFAIIMQTAWYGIRKNKPKTDDALLRLKIDLLKRLLKNGYKKEQIGRLISFIKHYVSFSEKEFFSKFDKSEQLITKLSEPMGIHEAILYHTKEEGREEGREEGKVSTLQVMTLILLGQSLEQVAERLELPLNVVKTIVDDWNLLKDKFNNLNKN